MGMEGKEKEWKGTSERSPVPDLPLQHCCSLSHWKTGSGRCSSDTD